MSAATPSVLVASRDGDYRRMAATALAGAGFDVRTVVGHAKRIERQLPHSQPGVLVLEGPPAKIARIEAFMRGLAQPPALVVVSDRTDSECDHVEKWCPPEELVDAVIAAANRPARPRLRLAR